jgi:hypothetical protein
MPVVDYEAYEYKEKPQAERQPYRVVKYGL